MGRNFWSSRDSDPAMVWMENEKNGKKKKIKKDPIKGRMPGNRRPAPGKYYEKVYLK